MRFFLIAGLIWAVLFLVLAESTGMTREHPGPDFSDLKAELKQVSEASPNKTATMDPEQLKALWMRVELATKQAEQQHDRMRIQLFSSHVALTSFLCISAMALTFVSFVAWNRAVHGLKFSHSLSYLVVLDQGIPIDRDRALVDRTRTQMGLLLGFLEEAARVSEGLKKLAAPGGATVIAHTHQLLTCLCEKLRMSAVVKVHPHETTLSELGQMIARAEQARQDLEQLGPTLRTLTERRDALEKQVGTFTEQRDELERVRRLSEAEIRRCSQARREADDARAKSERALGHLTAKEASLLQLAEELRALWRLIHNADLATEGGLSAHVQGNGSSYPCLTRIARSFLGAVPG